MPLQQCLKMVTFFMAIFILSFITNIESPFQGMYNMMTCMFTLLHMASLVNVLKYQVDATFECPVIRFLYDKMSQVH